MLDGSIPEHAGHAGSLILKFWGTFFPVLGLILLAGSILLILTTNVGFRRGFQLVFTTFFGYLFMQALTWILSGNGPKVSLETTSYFGLRIWGVGIAVASLLIVTVMLISMHRAERRAQRVDSP